MAIRRLPGVCIDEPTPRSRRTYVMPRTEREEFLVLDELEEHRNKPKENQNESA